MKPHDVQPRSTARGGHHMLPTTSGGVWCPTCRRKAGKANAARFGQARCLGPVVHKWSKRARGEANPAARAHHSLPGLDWLTLVPTQTPPEDPPPPPPPPPFFPPAPELDTDDPMPPPDPPVTGHTVLVSGNVFWCSVCGQWTHDPECWPRRVCSGPPREGRGPREQRHRLARLRDGRHPDKKHTAMLPPAVPWQPSGARVPPRSVDGAHMPMRTGLIHWCRSCGCFASGSRARGLQEA